MLPDPDVINERPVPLKFIDLKFDLLLNFKQSLAHFR